LHRSFLRISATCDASDSVPVSSDPFKVWWAWTLIVGGCVVIFACRIPLIARPTEPIEANALSAILILSILLAPWMSASHMSWYRQFVITATLIPLALISTILSGESLSIVIVPLCLTLLWLAAVHVLLYYSVVLGVLLTLAAPATRYLMADFAPAASLAIPTHWIWAFVPTVGVSRAVHPLFPQALLLFVPPAIILAIHVLLRLLCRHRPIRQGILVDNLR
jgi:hypothetical protein